MINFKQWHHAYLGAIIAGIAYALAWGWLMIVGLVIMLDDIVQHLVQETINSEWKSPLAWAYSKVYPRVAWVRKLNTWLDSLFN